MRAMGSSARIVLVFDDELQRRLFAEHVRPGTQVYHVPGGDDLLKLAAAGALDVAVVGVLNRTDPLLPSALRELSALTPEIAIIGVFESSRPSLDEAADMARELPAIGFVRRPGARFDYLARRRAPGSPAPTFTAKLLDCMDRLPLFGPAHRFARLQALHPSCAPSIPEDARELGLSRRNLERWFQGPDLCSAGCFQSVSAAGEAAYLRLVCGMPERDIASVVGVLTREGVINPMAVPRMIRSALRLGLEDLRAGGVPAIVEGVNVALRTSRDPTRIPAQWEPDTRFAVQPGILPVPREGHVVLMDLSRASEHLLDPFGEEAWPLLVQGAPLASITANLASLRREPPHAVRARLISWLGELLVLGFIRRERGAVEADEA
jgi:hypothetical protein